MINELLLHFSLSGIKQKLAVLKKNWKNNPNFIDYHQGIQK